MVKGLANLVKFLIFLPKLTIFLPKLLQLVLVVEALLGELSDLHLIVLRVEELPLCLFELHPQELNLIREALDFNGLEHDDEVHVLAEIVLLVVGQVLDPGSSLRMRYFRRSSAYATESLTMAVEMKDLPGLKFWKTLERLTELSLSSY